MALFSERMGYKPARSVIQVETIDEALRTGLWNVMDRFMWARLDYRQGHVDLAIDTRLHGLCRAIWADHFKQRLDSMPLSWDRAYGQIQTAYLAADWHAVFSFVEFVRSRFRFETARPDKFDASINVILEREMAGYRLVGGAFTPITSPAEINQVEQALGLRGPFQVVSQHMDAALARLTDKPQPDYRNSIKESISAVEAMCSLIAGQDKADLDAALHVIEKSIGLHGALKAGFGKLYGYTSDAGGIRHALLEESSLTAEDAIFMLVTCSAFINYLKALTARAGLTIAAGR